MKTAVPGRVAAGVFPLGINGDRCGRPDFARPLDTRRTERMALKLTPYLLMAESVGWQRGGILTQA